MLGSASNGSADWPNYILGSNIYVLKSYSNVFIFHLQFAMCFFQAREANSIGDRMKAEQSSRTAKTLNHVALGLGLGMVVLCIIYVVVVASIVAN